MDISRMKELGTDELRQNRLAMLVQSYTGDTLQNKPLSSSRHRAGGGDVNIEQTTESQQQQEQTSSQRRRLPHIPSQSEHDHQSEQARPISAADRTTPGHTTSSSSRQSMITDSGVSELGSGRQSVEDRWDSVQSVRHPMRVGTAPLTGSGKMSLHSGHHMHHRRTSPPASRELRPGSSGSSGYARTLEVSPDTDTSTSSSIRDLISSLNDRTKPEPVVASTTTMRPPSPQPSMVDDFDKRYGSDSTGRFRKQTNMAITPPANARSLTLNLGDSSEEEMLRELRHHHQGNHGNGQRLEPPHHVKASSALRSKLTSNLPGRFTSTIKVGFKSH